MHNNINQKDFSEAINSLNKIETVTKVLNKTITEDLNFDILDNQNLCSVLLREISYTKSKLNKDNL